MCSDCSLLIMDELGPHEAKAALFRQEILRILDEEPVICEVKNKKDIVFNGADCGSM